jgi:hypothetical protein
MIKGSMIANTFAATWHCSSLMSARAARGPEGKVGDADASHWQVPSSVAAPTSAEPQPEGSRAHSDPVGEAAGNAAVSDSEGAGLAVDAAQPDPAGVAAGVQQGTGTSSSEPNTAAASEAPHDGGGAHGLGRARRRAARPPSAVHHDDLGRQAARPPPAALPAHWQMSC